jgi:branched-chain amino acid transport system ATP-binding protein
MTSGPEARSVGAAVLLEGRAVTAEYGRIQVLSGVDFDVSPGEIVAVLGANGAGKSSFLGALAGSVKSTGDVRLGGERLTGLAAHRRAKLGLALVPEGRRNIFRVVSAAENLEVGLNLAPRHERAETLEFICGLFPILRDRLSVAAGMLSGGEQQMLAIGVALGRRPRALLLDEPTQGLAPAIFDVLETALARLRGAGVAILLAEQNLGFAARVANRYLVLAHGMTVASGHQVEMHDVAYMSSHYFGTTTEREPSEHRGGGN